MFCQLSYEVKSVWVCGILELKAKLSNTNFYFFWTVTSCQILLDSDVAIWKFTNIYSDNRWNQRFTCIWLINCHIYIIIYCTIECLNTSILFCVSVDCVKWGLLPQVTEEMRQNCSFVKGRFTGDPSYEYEHTETKRNEDRDSDPDQDEETTVSLVIAGCI